MFICGLDKGSIALGQAVGECIRLLSLLGLGGCFLGGFRLRCLRSRCGCGVVYQRVGARSRASQLLGVGGRQNRFGMFGKAWYVGEVGYLDAVQCILRQKTRVHEGVGLFLLDAGYGG